MFRELATFFIVIGLLLLGRNCIAQQDFQKEISKSWLTNNGYELKLVEDGNVIEDGNDIKNFWLSNDTILFGHYVGSKILSNEHIDKNEGLIVTEYDTIPALSYFSNFQIEKLSEDSLILRAIDSNARCMISAEASRFIFSYYGTESIVRLFSLDKVYNEYHYDSLNLELCVNGHFEECKKDFTIYANGDYNYKKDYLKYSEEKHQINQYSGTLSSDYKEKFQEAVNKSGMEYFSRRFSLSIIEHAENCRLEIFCQGKVYIFNNPRYNLPVNIEKLVNIIYQLEMKTE